jgi:hypothetical protein
VITRDQYMMGRDREYPTTEEQEVNCARLLWRVNAVLKALGLDTVVNSGYRPGHYNVMARGAPNSAHLTCEAVDLRDPSEHLEKVITDGILVHFGLYAEDVSATPGWIHLQIRAPKSGNRRFKP